MSAVMEAICVETVAIEVITPAMAMEMLAVNKKNRILSAAKVADYADRMRRDRWWLGWDAIAITRDGNLRNGQHRLEATVASGTTQPFIILRGVSEDAADAGDRGTRRTIAHALQRRGESSCCNLAALLRAIWGLEVTGSVICGQGGSTGDFAPEEAFGLLARYPHTRAFATKRHSLPAIRDTQGNFLRFLFHEVDPVDAEAFWNSVRDGALLTPEDPRFVLRAQLLGQAQSRDKLPEKTLVAWTIKAWNKWRRGETARYLRWKGGGALAEAMPTIDGFDYDAWVRS